MLISLCSIGNILQLLFGLIAFTQGLPLRTKGIDFWKERAERPGLSPFYSSIVTASRPTRTPRWHRPCSGSRPTGGVISDVPISLDDLEEHIRDFIVELERTLISTEKYKNLYVKKRRMHTNYLHEVYLPGFPDIEEWENTIEMLSDDELALLIVKTYEELSTVAAFLEQSKRDEKNYEHSTFLEPIQVMENHVYYLLCHLRMVISCYELEINDVNRDVVPEVLRMLRKRSDRHDRDFILMRDMEALLRTLLSKFIHAEEVFEFSISFQKKYKPFGTYGCVQKHKRNSISLWMLK